MTRKKAVARKKPLKRFVSPIEIDDETTQEEIDEAMKEELAGLEVPPPKNHPVFVRAWSNLLDNVMEKRDFKRAHLLTLEILCDLYVEMDEILKFLEKHGRNYYVKNEAEETYRNYNEVAALDRVRMKIKMYSSSLGLFPNKERVGKRTKDNIKEDVDAEEWS